MREDENRALPTAEMGVAEFVLGIIPLTVVALIGIIAAQTVWSIGASILMLRSR